MPSTPNEPPPPPPAAPPLTAGEDKKVPLCPFDKKFCDERCLLFLHQPKLGCMFWRGMMFLTNQQINFEKDLNKLIQLPPGNRRQ